MPQFSHHSAARQRAATSVWWARAAGCFYGETVRASRGATGPPCAPSRMVLRACRAGALRGTGKRPASGRQELRTASKAKLSVRPVAPRAHPVRRRARCYEPVAGGATSLSWAAQRAGRAGASPRAALRAGRAGAATGGATSRSRVRLSTGGALWRSGFLAQLRLLLRPALQCGVGLWVLWDDSNGCHESRAERGGMQTQ